MQIIPKKKVANIATYLVAHLLPDHVSQQAVCKGLDDLSLMSQRENSIPM